MKMNPKASLVAVAAFMGLSLHGTQASTVIDFTSGEGYVNGDLWSQTPGSGEIWTANTTYTVATGGGGSVTVPTTSGNYSGPARYSQAFASTAGQVLSLSMDFNFVGVDVTSAPAGSGDRQYLANMNFGTSPNGVYSSIMGGSLLTVEFAPANTYSFQVSSGNYVNFAPTDIGLTSTGGTNSNNLRLTLTATVATLGNSNYTLDLFNLTTSSSVFSVDGVADLTGFNNLYAGFSGGGSNIISTALNVSSLSIASVPEPSTYLLLLGGLGLLGVMRYHRNKAC